MLIPVVIHKSSDSDYGVTVPGVPGCFSAGITFEDALSESKKAILAHVECLLDYDMPVDIESKPIEEYQKDSQYEGGIWALVDVNLDQLSTVKTRFNVSWPEHLLSRLDNKLEETHETRSGFLAKIVLRELNKGFEVA